MGASSLHTLRGEQFADGSAKVKGAICESEFREKGPPAVRCSREQALKI